MEKLKELSWSAHQEGIHFKQWWLLVRSKPNSWTEPSYQTQEFGFERNKSHDKKSTVAKEGKYFRWTPHFTFGKISVSGCKIMANGMWDGTNCHHIADGPFGRALGTLMNEMGVKSVVDLGWTGMDLITLVGHFLTILFKQLVSRSHPLQGGVTPYLQDHDCLRSSQEFFSMWKPHILSIFDEVYKLYYCSFVGSWALHMFWSTLPDCIWRFFC